MANTPIKNFTARLAKLQRSKVFVRLKKEKAKHCWLTKARYFKFSNYDFILPTYTRKISQSGIAISLGFMLNQSILLTAHYQLPHQRCWLQHGAYQTVKWYLGKRFSRVEASAANTLTILYKHCSSQVMRALCSIGWLLDYLPLTFAKWKRPGKPGLFSLSFIRIWSFLQTTLQ